MVGLCEAKKKAEMRNPIWEAGVKGVLLVKKWFDRLTIPREAEGKHKMHKKNKKMTKNDQKSAL